MSAIAAKKIDPVIFESKYGFHPCDYQTFMKLKKLHKAYWETLRKLAAWFRWNAKQPQNRVLKTRVRDAFGKVTEVKTQPWNEPKYCPIFGTPTRKSVWDTIPGVVNDHGIIEAYQSARMPRKAEDVEPLKIDLEEIDELYDSLTEWQAS